MNAQRNHNRKMARAYGELAASAVENSRTCALSAFRDGLTERFAADAAERARSYATEAARYARRQASR